MRLSNVLAMCSLDRIWCCYHSFSAAFKGLGRNQRWVIGHHNYWYWYLQYQYLILHDFDMILNSHRWHGTLGRHGQKIATQRWRALWRGTVSRYFDTGLGRDQYHLVLYLINCLLLTALAGTRKQCMILDVSTCLQAQLLSLPKINSANKLVIRDTTLDACCVKLQF